MSQSSHLVNTIARIESGPNHAAIGRNGSLAGVAGLAGGRAAARSDTAIFAVSC